VFGGKGGSPAVNAKLDTKGAQHPLPGFYMGTVTPEENIIFRTVSGGGYGNPIKRDPMRVARDADRGWISSETARDVYGVALELADNGLDHLVDETATAGLRKGAAA
jgi:N-methylhydantoinase B